MASRTRAALVLALAAALITLGQTGASASAPDQPIPHPPVASLPELPAPYGPEQLNRDYLRQENAVAHWWDSHWTDYFTVPYRPPALVSDGTLLPGLYDGSKDTLSCNGFPLPPDNALYCGPPAVPSSNFLAFDKALLTAVHRFDRDFIAVVIAHEWGHVVQGQLPALERDIQYELQADCLAGAAVQGAADDGLLRLSPADLPGIDEGLAAFGDPLPWGMPGDHGTPRQRVDNLTLGLEHGVLACMPL